MVLSVDYICGELKRGTVDVAVWRLLDCGVLLGDKGFQRGSKKRCEIQCHFCDKKMVSSFFGEQ